MQDRHADEIGRLERKLEELKAGLKAAVERGDGLAEQLLRTKEQMATALEQAAHDLQQTITSYKVRVVIRATVVHPVVRMRWGWHAVCSRKSRAWRTNTRRLLMVY